MKGKTVAASSRSWVVDMEKLLETDAWLEEEQCERQYYIYRVPEWLKKATDRSAYMPELVSLGPFHHGHRDLLPMEEHKRRAMLHLVKRSGKPLHEFVDAVEKVAEELMGAYKDLTLQKPWRGENIKPRFVETMVVDGCFFVEVMRMVELRGILDDYASSDPVFSEHGYLYVWPTIKTDMILIENQLPLLLIKTILVLRDGEKHYQQNPGAIYGSVLDLLGRRRNEIDCSNQQGLHPLGILHTSFTYTPSRAVANREGCCQLAQHFIKTLRWLKSRQCWRREDDTESESTDELTDDNASSAEKMRESGIRFKKSASDSFLDVHFGCCGMLSLPFLQFDGDTTMILLNMMAFERLHTTARNDVTAYVYFLDDIIDTVKDVAVLKDAEIIGSEMGSDEELAKLLNNTLNSGIIMSPSSELRRVRREVYAHCKKRRNRWRASLIDTHFSNPWVFISLVAAVILLGATLVQTVCTVRNC